MRTHAGPVQHDDQGHGDQKGDNRWLAEANGQYARCASEQDGKDDKKERQKQDGPSQPVAGRVCGKGVAVAARFMRDEARPGQGQRLHSALNQEYGSGAGGARLGRPDRLRSPQPVHRRRHEEAPPKPCARQGWGLCRAWLARRRPQAGELPNSQPGCACAAGRHDRTGCIRAPLGQQLQGEERAVLSVVRLLTPNSRIGLSPASVRCSISFCQCVKMS